ncbi:IclR family transcriptional regulator [Sulfitobacter albidus]|uniref:IclR family transcriptional regulator n=1 Tax=Sulfitobacter albidus TaxID=2829501 RepID=A0A975JHH2_9RHOB|nr:IclR family transcriptional regulator [Sulfitobacter albidus]QUJ78281.1 IclR family transcriptional regulator [Sulfitobacter albidus]
MDHFDPDLDGKDRNFVTALARGLEILRCFRSNEVTLTNSDFSERTGLPKATISRLTHTLCALDYLVADTRVGTYRLSGGVLQLGFAALSSMDISDRAAPEMRALREEGPNPFITVALGEQHRNDVVYLATETSSEDVSLVIRVGSRLPLYHSAIGKAILVGMSEPQRARVFAFARDEGPEFEAEAHALFDAAHSEFAERGFCSGYGSWRPDVNGIAVPVVQAQEGRVYGLNVGGPAYRVKPKQLEGIYAERLIKAAGALSIQT